MDKKYESKFARFRELPLYLKLKDSEQRFIERISLHYRLTFQQFRQIVEASRDLDMWQETLLENWWVNNITDHANRDEAMKKLRTYMDSLKRIEKDYSGSGFSAHRESKQIIARSSSEKIYGMCPVASDKTVCCQLRTIDAVQNCVFGCSYCSIQTFYTDSIIIDQNLIEKLGKIEIDPHRFYHFGSGQASDSLACGNREGILDAQCRFAQKYPNILLEFKTKSDNITYFTENEIPANVVCSWSLNTQKIIDHEEHFTVSIDRRLKSARQVADQGIKVAFHFHPLVYYSGWTSEYQEVARDIINMFKKDEVLFISFGSVTLIKPVIRKIRDLGNPSKILQMQLVSDPHGRLTYPDDIKVRMFRSLYSMFKPWHREVFFYLCMEKASIWKGSLGYTYESNDLFEKEFAAKTMIKCFGKKGVTVPANPSF